MPFFLEREVKAKLTAVGRGGGRRYCCCSYYYFYFYYYSSQKG